MVSAAIGQKELYGVIRPSAGSAVTSYLWGVIAGPCRKHLDGWGVCREIYQFSNSDAAKVLTRSFEITYSLR